MMFNKFYKNYQKMMAYHNDTLFPVLTKADLDKCGVDSRIGVLLTIEDGGVLGDKIGNVKKFYDKGVRLVTLTWNHENAIGYPNSYEPEIMNKGLKPFGKEVVKEMERLGMVVDVSHVSDGVFWDVAEMATKPFLASHSNSRAMCEHRRNLTDERFLRIARRGGIVGVSLAPQHLTRGEICTVHDVVSNNEAVRRASMSKRLAIFLAISPTLRIATVLLAVAILANATVAQILSSAPLCVRTRLVINSTMCCITPWYVIRANIPPAIIDIKINSPIPATPAVRLSIQAIKL
jgi:hypothetical protein